MVKQQVESQIRVADLSSMEVSVHPADYADWGAACEAQLMEATAPLRAELKACLRRHKGDAEKIGAINAEFTSRIEQAQAEFSHKPMEMHMQIKTTYNFLDSSKSA